MDVENTKTPNGASRDLYSKNKTVGETELVVTDMSQKDPVVDLTGINPGDNTVIEEYTIIDNTTAIRDFGSVRIGATLVGQPIKFGPEASSVIKPSVEEIKNAFKRKGAISFADYAKMKIESEKSKMSREEDKEQEQEQK